MSILSASDSVRNALKPFYLFGYRGGAFLVISAGLLFLLTWGFIIFFFMFSTSWIAPTVLSSTSDKMLQYDTGHASVLQSQSQMRVILQQQALSLVTSQKQYDQLVAFRDSIQAGKGLEAKKLLDLKNSADLSAKLEQSKLQTEQNLRTGLVDKLDAIKEIASIQQFNNTRTDSEIGLATLKQQLITLDAQILTLSDTITVERQTIGETQANLQTVGRAIQALESSEYGRADKSETGAINLVFVPYDNFNKVHEGDAIYDCYLMVVLCHQVGTVKHLFKDEQLIEFPIFNIKLSRTVRGVYAEVDVTKPSAIKSSVWFAGSKPFYIL
jgi:hypothetical protein